MWDLTPKQWAELPIDQCFLVSAAEAIMHKQIDKGVNVFLWHNY
jgi:hypothetical protein